MPIYAYRCESCGHAKDVLQKISDPVLSTCPACGAESFKKQVTAAGFDAFLSKPINLKEFLDAVKQMVEGTPT